MPATSRAAVQSLAAFGLIAAIAATSSRASASLLDEPPKRTSFDLNETAAPALPLLRAFRNAAVERPGPLRLYLSSTYGRWQQEPWWQLVWGGAKDQAQAQVGLEDTPSSQTLNTAGSGAWPFASHASPYSSLFELPGTLHVTRDTPNWLRHLDPGFSTPLLAYTGPSFASDGFDQLWEPPRPAVRDWRCQRGPVLFGRYGGEHDRFELVRCDGSVAPGALDRLSILARPPEAPDPGRELPDEPDADAWQRALEWVPQVRLVHPRLLWLLQQIADAFPNRSIYIYSGYRPRAPGQGGRAKSGGHHSQHAEGRAMDIAVRGVPNAALFQVCRTLNDVACGFYPNSKFVHVDVRRPGTGRLFWIDASAPGEPSRYVDGWPGVVESGGLSWGVQANRGGAAAPR